ncbi:TIGR03943 family protein [Microbacterium lacus]|uniref:TIGR03943 family putative permease subunit n=1 Tax=Microbacterium lacus TaxID=415217 RepID=UPI00384CDB7C
MSRSNALATRWLGVGLASALAVVTVSLSLTGRIGLYINPESSWFAVGMAVLLLVGAILSFLLPLGAESDHGHDHGHDGGDDSSDAEGGHEHHSPQGIGLVASVVGGVVASAIVIVTLVLPPASLSAELAISRDVGAPPLFVGADTVALAATGDTASFGIGEWSAVFATATNPEAFDGAPVTLTGFVTPGSDFALTRLVITHCVIDAQTASVPVTASIDVPDTGQWVTVTGTVRSTTDGQLRIDATEVELIDEPVDPYEY